MSIPDDNTLGIVRPGEGVPVQDERLAPIRNELRSGIYVIDSAQLYVHQALADSATTTTEAKAILNMPSNKIFRNAYISIVMEEVWPSYSTFAADDDPDLYALEFNDNEAHLVRQPEEITANLSLAEVADLIAVSNQDIATYFSCRLFSDGKVPEICGDAEIDRTYFNAFHEQTELQFARTNKYFETIPSSMDSASKFVASGLQVIRTYIFGIPNLVDSVSLQEGISLTSSQHRVGVETTLAKSITPYYSLTGPLITDINSRLADDETGTLLPDRWMSNGEPDRFIVFPKPDIIRRANEEAARRDDLPVQTRCPVFHSRVATMESPDEVIPLTRSLAQIALRQWDLLYYPKRP